MLIRRVLLCSVSAALALSSTLLASHPPAKKDEPKRPEAKTEPKKEEPKKDDKSKGKPANDNVLSVPVETLKDVSYQLVKPATVESGKKMPLLVYLHAGGRRGAAAVTLPVPLRDQVMGVASKHPCFVLAPICPKDAKWASLKGQPPTMQNEPTAVLAAVLEIVEKVVRENPIDPDRVYITGDQIGGDGALEAALRRPNLFAAALPLGPNPDVSSLEKCTTPVYAFVDSEEARKALETALKQGCSQSRAEKAEGNVVRDPWSKAAAMDWLFSQRRSTRGK